MQLVEQKNNVQESENFKSYKFGIAEDGMAHIFGILRNSLYSDKIGSLMRETSANAYDAHVMKGIANQPFHVTLPNRLNLNFKVRDFGDGLSEEDMERLYAQYGRSTKRDSNQAIGCFGIGKFAPLGYGDSFVVNSYHKNCHKSYLVFIDETKIGKISKMSEQATTEPDGLEVVVPVKKEDVEIFAHKAVKFFKYFKIKPVFKGAEINFSKDKPEISGSFWEIYASERYNSFSAMVVMGNVGYPISSSSLKCNDQRIIQLLNTNIVVEFELGELSVSASRENLQYDERTNKNLTAKLNKVLKELEEIVKDKMKNCETLFQAKKVYSSIFNYDSPLYQVSSVIKTVFWKNNSITDGRFSFDYRDVNNATNALCSVKSYHKSFRGNNIRSSECSSFDAEKKTVLILNDKDLKSGITNRVYGLINDGKSPIVFHIKDKSFLKKYNLEEKDFILLSSLPVHTFAKGNSGGSAYKSTKHSAKAFVWDTSKTGYQSTRSNYWIQEDVDLKNGSGVYVELNCFDWKSNNGTLDTSSYQHPSCLHSFLKDFKTLGINFPKVYGFKAGVLNAVKKNSNFISFKQYVSNTLESFVKNNNLSQEISDAQEFKNNKVEWWTNLKYASQKVSFPAKSPLHLALNKILFCERGISKVQKYLDAFDSCSFKVKTVKPTHDLASINKEILSRYSMFELVDWPYVNRSGVEGKSHADILLAYVLAVDSTSA